MKKYKYIFIILLLIFITSSCYKNNEEQYVVTTIYPYYMITNEIAGDSIKIINLLPPTASPHTYAPKPSDIENLINAELIIANGFDLEVNLEKKIRELDAKAFIIADSFPNLRKTSTNPHIWLDPIIVIDIVNMINNKLCEIDKKHKEYYTHNKDHLIEKIKNTYDKIKDQSKIYKNRGVITYHNSFYYFLKRFNIKNLICIEKNPGKEPSPKELEKIGEIIKNNKIKVIYREPQLNPKSAQILAHEYNVEVYSLDPLGTSLDVFSITQLFMYNWNQIKQGFNID